MNFNEAMNGMRKGKVDSSVKSPTIELVSVVFKEKCDIECILIIKCVVVVVYGNFMVKFYGYYNFMVEWVSVNITYPPP